LGCSPTRRHRDTAISTLLSGSSLWWLSWLGFQLRRVTTSSWGARLLPVLVAHIVFFFPMQVQVPMFQRSALSSRARHRCSNSHCPDWRICKEEYSCIYDVGIHPSSGLSYSPRSLQSSYSFWKFAASHGRCRGIVLELDGIGTYSGVPETWI